MVLELGRLVRLLRAAGDYVVLDLRALGRPGRRRVARRDRAFPTAGRGGTAHRSPHRRCRRRSRAAFVAQDRARLRRTSQTQLLPGREPFVDRRDATLSGPPGVSLPYLRNRLGVGHNRDHASLEALIRAAAGGDEEAWSAIVDRFAGLVWSTARAHRLAPAEAADVAQTTWLRLVENLDRITEPERLGAWLATTARRECLRHIRLQSRELPTGDDALFEAPSDDRAEQRLITRERTAAVRRAFREDQRPLSGAPAAAGGARGAFSYDEIAAALDMPIGAIGPTRARCLDQLRRTPELAAFGIG